MARVLSFTSSFFSAAFVILLVLGLLALGNRVVADEPLGPPPIKEPCAYPDETGGCPAGNDQCSGDSSCCCYCFCLLNGFEYGCCDCFESCHGTPDC